MVTRLHRYKVTWLHGYMSYMVEWLNELNRLNELNFLRRNGERALGMCLASESSGSAGFQSAVSPTSSRLLVQGISSQRGPRAVCGLEIRDTAD